MLIIEKNAPRAFTRALIRYPRYTDNMNIHAFLLGKLKLLAEFCDLRTQVSHAIKSVKFAIFDAIEKEIILW